MNVTAQMLSVDADRLIALYEYFDVPIPGAALDAQAVINAAKAEIAREPLDDLRADVAAGNVTAKTIGTRLREAALAEILKPGMRTVANELAFVCDNAVMAALRGNPDAVADQIRDRFHAAVDRLLSGGRVFSVAAFENPAELLKARDDASTIYRDMGAALAELEQIAVFVRLLYRLDNVNVPQVAFFVNVDDSVEIADLTQAWATPVPVRRWLGLFMMRGVTPAFHSGDEARSVVAYATANAESRAAARRNKRTPLAAHKDAMAKVEAERWQATVAPAQ